MPLEGSTVDRIVVLLALGALLPVVVLALRRSPRAAITVWIAALAFVPVWLGTNVVFYFPPAVLLGGVVLIVLWPTAGFRWEWVDLGFAIFALVCLAPVAIGGSTATSLFVVVTQWGLAFAIGRTAAVTVDPEWIYKAVAVVFVLVSIGAIVEFVLQANPFVLLDTGNAAYQVWGTLQERAGLLRAEWAFGHSIALGCSIALAIPITIGSRLNPWVRVVLLLLMLAAVALSFSRAAMLSAVLGVLLALLFLDLGLTARGRVAAVIVLGMAAFFGLPYLSGVFASAGDEVTSSVGYRQDLFDLWSHLSPLGYSPVAHRAADGTLLFGRFQSIDNAVLLVGLTYGWLALAALLGLMAVGIVVVVLRKATPALVAVVALLPAFFTVAWITQYSMWVWFVAGLAVTAQGRRRAVADVRLHRRRDSAIRPDGNPGSAARGLWPTMGHWTL